jgi:hypothetical protein
MAQPNHTQLLAQTEEALTILYCLVHDACLLLNLTGGVTNFPSGSQTRRSSLSPSCSSCGAWSRNAPSSETPRGSSLTCSPGGGAPSFLVAPQGAQAQALIMEPLRREIVSELVGDPEPLLSSTPPCLPCCILGRSLSPRFSGSGLGGGVPSASTG